MYGSVAKVGILARQTRLVDRGRVDPRPIPVDATGIADRQCHNDGCTYIIRCFAPPPAAR
jgi:hypothetical protein